MSYGLGAYKKTSIHTASKEQILLMLYQAAIKNCKKAIEAIEQRNIPAKGEYIGKLQDIVIELNNSLDFEVGGDIAKELSSLYDFILFSSTQANIKIEAEPLNGVLNVLNTLYEGWGQAIKSLRKESAAEGNGA
ncbi:flagellar export chaperone FliS [Halobacteriovorax sp. HLS]|uniref:flagellar export chaperone FliS n=1 Tax=Halobacteriovorax sp. HLS TaxID=2234000 RepID=UPI000FD7C97A|nr:flagellar export chaperone FliS [Halobacteriovorax sp. HLS]